MRRARFRAQARLVPLVFGFVGGARAGICRTRARSCILTASVLRNTSSAICWLAAQHGSSRRDRATRAAFAHANNRQQTLQPKKPQRTTIKNRKPTPYSLKEKNTPPRRAERLTRPRSSGSENYLICRQDVRGVARSAIVSVPTSGCFAPRARSAHVSRAPVFGTARAAAWRLAVLKPGGRSLACARLPATPPTSKQ